MTLILLRLTIDTARENVQVWDVFGVQSVTKQPLWPILHTRSVDAHINVFEPFLRLIISRTVLHWLYWA